MSKEMIKRNVKKKKKSWKTPEITDVKITRRDLLQQFGTGWSCSCTSPTA